MGGVTTLGGSRERRRLRDEREYAQEALQSIRENFSSGMLGSRRYLVWKYAEHGDKPAKIPYIAGGGGRASSTDPTTWRGFEEAADAFRTGNHDGIGVVFSVEDPYAGVDLDECRKASHDLPGDGSHRCPRDLADVMSHQTYPT
jgi:hypothetical protein